MRPRRTEPSRPAGWHEFVEDLVAQGEANLWTDRGSKARAFLRGLGLAEETIRAARLGYWAEDVQFTDVYADGWLRVPRGILIPWCEGAAVEGVRVRRPVKPPAAGGPSDPTFITLRGSRRGLYPRREPIRPGRPLVLVAEEFDALLLGQHLGDLASVVSLGSTLRPRCRDFSAMLGATAWILSASGWEAANWLSSTDRFSRVMPPEGSGPSWVEAHRAGIDLRAWWARKLDGPARRATPSTDSPAWRAEDPPTVSPPKGTEPAPITNPFTVDKGAMPSGPTAAASFDADEIPSTVRKALARGRVKSEAAELCFDIVEADDGRWRCRNPYCFTKGGWWMSAQRVVNCLNCRPPAFPSLVVATGVAEDAPMVEADRSSQALGDVPVGQGSTTSTICPPDWPGHGVVSLELGALNLPTAWT